MKSNFSKVLFVALTLALCMTLFSSVACAQTLHSISISFVAGKEAYGPGTYYRKGNTTPHWNATYVSGPSSTTGVYLYDRTYGDRATHIVWVSEGDHTDEQEFPGSYCCQSSHEYKIVAKRDLSEFSGTGTYSYDWTN